MELVRFATSAVNLQSSSGQNDDSVDRLHWKATTSLLLIFALVLSTKQYVGTPIDCWCPAEFTSNYVTYTQHLCWIKNTYYVPLGSPVPDDDALKMQLVYYQWTPFILLFQAFLFTVPWMVWSWMTSHIGVNISDITEASNGYSLSSKFDSKEKTIDYISKQIHYFLDFRKSFPDSTICMKLKLCCTRGKGNYIIACYLLVKLLYLANAVSQLFLLNWFLGSTDESFGKAIWNSLNQGSHLPSSKQFPRVTLCDFSVRGYPENVRPYTVECVLSINLFNEKIFAFIWCWLNFISVVTCANLMLWLYRIALPWSRTEFLRRQLRTTQCYKRGQCKKKVVAFISDYLHMDGMFVLRLLSINSTDIVTSEVTRALWQLYSRQLETTPDAVSLADCTTNDLPHLKLEKSQNDLDKHTLLSAKAVDNSITARDYRDKNRLHRS